MFQFVLFSAILSEISASPRFNWILPVPRGFLWDDA